MSDRKSKYLSGVGLYDLVKNNVELANHLYISKVTVGKFRPFLQKPIQVLSK